MENIAKDEDIQKSLIRERLMAGWIIVVGIKFDEHLFESIIPFPEKPFCLARKTKALDDFLGNPPRFEELLAIGFSFNMAFKKTVTSVLYQADKNRLDAINKLLGWNE